MLIRRSPRANVSFLRTRLHSLFILLLFLLAMMEVLCPLESASGQIAQPLLAREYIYLDGKIVAIEEDGYKTNLPVISRRSPYP